MFVVQETIFASECKDMAITNSAKLDPSVSNKLIQVHQAEFDWIHNTNAFQRLKHLSSLKDNWDGYGAQTFTRQHIQRALDLFEASQDYFNKNNLSFSHYSPFIAPCSDGEILFEWRGRLFPQRDLEIFVSRNLSQPFTYLKTDLMTNTDTEDSFVDPNFGHTLLKWLLEP